MLVATKPEVYLSVQKVFFLLFRTQKYRACSFANACLAVTCELCDCLAVSCEQGSTSLCHFTFSCVTAKKVY